MKLLKYQKYLILTLAITIVIIGFYSILGQFGDRSKNVGLFYNIVFTLLVSINIILVNFPIFEKIKTNYPLNKGFLKSVIIGFVITSITASIIISIWVFIFYYTVTDYCINADVEKYGLEYVIFTNIVTAIIVNVFIGAFTLIRYSTIEWKKALIEAEEFKRRSIETQYTTLLEQINPHFLFNSLNALASLIPQSPEKAVEFVNKFSKIYRYVLDVKDKLVCEVKDELDFADSYCFLQKIRFGENLIIEKNIDSEYLNLFLPPLSLQLLVENAIKHNEISKLNPLKINIHTQNGFVIVENTIRLKSVGNEISGIGLKNLTERYLHLCDKKPAFYIENNVYIAKIPFIIEE
jgi:two-component system, LytTR family, sensor kinase